MAKTEEQIQINCLVGQPAMLPDGTWTCINPEYPPYNYPSVLPTVMPPIRNTARWWEKYMMQATPPIVATGATDSTVNALTGNALLDWVKGHPFITAGAVGLLLFFFFMKGGGKFAGKTRTEVTRWGG